MPELEEKNKNDYRRLFIFSIAIMVIFAVLGLRLFTLQVLQASAYTSAANNNQLRIISQSARRGNIYDANMVELATSKPVFCISISTPDVTDKKALAEKLATLLNDPEITPESILEAINNNARSYETVLITRLNYEEGVEKVAILEENRADLGGVLVSEEPMRYYPNGSLTGHVIGTVGLIGESDLDLVNEGNYLINDWLGKTGLESYYENYMDENGQQVGLKGQYGIMKIEVNSRNKFVSTQSTSDAVAGNSLVLTLDAKVQAAMEESLASTIKTISKTRPKCQAGSAVLLDVETGGVIAMASYPTMDPNDFAEGLSQEQTKYYWDENTKPTFNRAISGAYPPGSTFKPVTALAGLIGDVYDINTYVNCCVSNWVQPRARCSAEHGSVNLIKAMQVSCNTFFQEIGYRAGIDLLYDTASALGLGSKTGIDLPGEVSGTLANPEWKAKNFTGWEATWRNYDTYYMSMGQGYNQYTPLQLANYTAAIANDGVRMVPYLVESILDCEGNVVWENELTVGSQVDCDIEDIELVQRAMAAVAEPGGVAYGLFGNYGVKVAVKTGTAQTGLVSDDKSKDYHGVFIAYAPADDPQVAFACVIEYGYHGSTSAAYVCKAVFDEYFGFNDLSAEKENTQSTENIEADFAE